MVGVSKGSLDPKKVITSPAQAIEIRRMAARLSRALRFLKLPGGLTPERLNVLGTILASGPVSLTALSLLEEVTPGTISRAVAALEGKGLVRRREHKSDRRASLISVTAKGRQSHDRAHAALLAHIVEAVSGFSRDELNALRPLLANMEKSRS